MVMTKPAGVRAERQWFPLEDYRGWMDEQPKEPVFHASYALLSALMSKTIDLTWPRVDASRSLELRAEVDACDFVVGFAVRDGMWAAFDALIGDYGEGATCAEALTSLIESLLADREALRERKEELADRLARDLALLETLPDEL